MARNFRRNRYTTRGTNFRCANLVISNCCREIALRWRACLYLPLALALLSDATFISEVGTKLACLTVGYEIRAATVQRPSAAGRHRQD